MATAGAMSPDEERRAARARERAIAAEKAAERHRPEQDRTADEAAAARARKAAEMSHKATPHSAPDASHAPAAATAPHASSVATAPPSQPAAGATTAANAGTHTAPSGPYQTAHRRPRHPRRYVMDRYRSGRYADGREPRVGDAVPPSVRLGPLPPGYRYPPRVAERGPYEEDLPPPRRFYYPGDPRFGPAYPPYPPPPYRFGGPRFYPNDIGPP